jgi:hypothetical protein
MSMGVFNCPVCWAKTDSYRLCDACADKRRKAVRRNCEQGGGREEEPTPLKVAKVIAERNVITAGLE